jgi:hypothetical protein
MSRSLTAVLATGILIFFTSISTKAYDNDTHFWLTYYLAVKAGYTPIQAEQIASANVSVDFDDDTEPVTPDLNNIIAAYRFKSTFSQVRSKFHALASKADIESLKNRKNVYWWDPERPRDVSILVDMELLVRKRKEQFWSETVAAKKNPGMFLHYLQDVYAHRDFASFYGHAGYRRIDHLSSDREKATQMTFSTLRYLIAFRLAMTGRLTKEYRENPERIGISNYLSVSDLKDVEATIKEFCDVNPSVGVEESAITKKWRTLKEDSKTDYSTPSNFLLPAMYEAYKENTAPDSRRAREVVTRRLGLDISMIPEIWLYDYSQSGAASPFTSFARVYPKYKTPIDPTHDYPAKSEGSNTKRTVMRDQTTRKLRLCMPFALVSDATKWISVCPQK